MKRSNLGLGVAAPRFIILGLALLVAPSSALAQEMISAAPPQETVEEAAPAEKEPQKESEADAVQRRVARARALAAVGKLAAAASDLEAVRASTADESARDVARILLMSIYVEMPDYARAGSLLEETFEARAAQGEASKRAYYALAGQTVKSVRVHLERYRSFGIDVADGELPTEANGDLDQLRLLLERVAKQAKAIREDEEKAQGAARAMDATALLEDAASVRLRLARTGTERADWQREVSDARQRLFIPETHIASIGGVPPARPPAAAPSPNAAPPAAQKSAGGATQTPTANAAGAPAPVREAVTAPSAPAPTDAAARDEAAKAAVAGGPVAVGSLVGRATQKISPSYPPMARTAGITGVVTVFVVVNAKGEVETVERADGPAQLQRAATEAARRWKFRPTVVDGQPVRVTGYVSFNFTL